MARMGPFPGNEVCSPTKAVPHRWAGLTLTLCWILPQDLVLAFTETKYSLCARMCELGVLHYTSLELCIPRQQLGWCHMTSSPCS